MILYVWLLCTLAYFTNCFLLPHNADRSVAPIYRQGNSMVINFPGCTTLLHCVDKLKQVHTESGLAVSLMGPALTRSQILQILPSDVLLYNHVESLIELYTTTNGIQYADDHYELQQLWLFPNYFLLSLEEAKDLYLNFPRGGESPITSTNMANQDTEIAHSEFDLSSFPIMASGMGGYIFVNLSDGSVFEYSPFEGDHMKDEFIREDSIIELFRGINIGFEKGDFLIENYVATSNEITSEPDIVEELDEIRFQTTQNKFNDEVQKRKKRSRGKHLRLHQTTSDLGDNTLTTLKPMPKQRLFNRHGIPLLYLSCDQMQMVCENIRLTISTDNKLRGLCKITDRKQAFINSRSACGTVKRRKGWDCNVFPFVSTSKAGEKENINIKLVPSAQNSVEGIQLNEFFRKAKIAEHRRNRCFRLVNL